MSYRRIKAHRDQHPTRLMCSALEVSPSGYYGWLRRPESTRRREDRRLEAEIRACFEASKRTYGSPRIGKDLRELGYSCSGKRIARIMRQSGLRALPRRKYRYTTDSDHAFPVAANVLERRFTAEAPNRVWVGDVTYIGTEEGWLYLAVLMDLYSRRIVGCNTADRNDRYLVLGALEEALRLRRPEPGLVHHTDQGAGYASYEYQARLTRAQAVVSMSRKGDCYDNAAMESFFSLLKRERVHRRKYWQREEAAEDIAAYIDFYNRTRRHSHIGDIGPVVFEQCRT